MKVLHVNSYDRGGAANACIRLHISFSKSGVDSHLLFLQRFEDKPISNSAVFEMSSFKRKPLWKRVLFKLVPVLKKVLNRREETKSSIRRLIPDTLEWFSFPDTGMDITRHPLYKEADVIHLHWISDFLDYSFFEKNDKPVVWTLHDMNAFTGGCHYSFGCTKFQNNCDDCPQLQSIEDKNFSSEILSYKEKYLLKENNTTLVSPSKWLESEIKSSKIFDNKKVFHIPYGIDSEIFQPQDREASRKLLGLPADKKIILFISYFLLGNKRKGYEYLLDSFRFLEEFNKDTVLCVVGGKSNVSKSLFSIFEHATVKDEYRMSLFYSACDLFVIPSLEDNLPNTVIESIMCGTPVVGFPVGGIKDMIIDGENGYLAEAVSPESLAISIRKFLLHPDALDRGRIRENALVKYSSSIQAEAYCSLYKKILS